MRNPSGVSKRCTKDVVRAQWDPGVALDVGVEHVEERERALEVEAPGTQSLGGKT